MSVAFKQLLENVTSQGYRSNVVKPLIGMTIVLLLATGCLFYYRIPLFGYITGCLSIVVIIAFLFCYFYCLFKNPDLLRSERYNLEKSAIEKVIQRGDSMHPQIVLPQRDFLTTGQNDATERQ